jgi:hypothetical protein
LHLVEHEHLAPRRRHLDRAADDRRALVDALLAGDQADLFLAELGGQPPVRLLRQHAQRPRVDAPALLLQHLERVVGLAEFVGPRCATTVSGSTWRSGRTISMPRSARRTEAFTPAAPARAWRSERIGRRVRPRPGLRPPGMGRA